MAYWDKYTGRRLNRRRFIGSTGLAASGVAGLALVGCGDDDDDPDATATTATGATTGPGATTAPDATATTAGGPTVGGTLRYSIFGVNSGDPPTLYPYENISYQVQTPAGHHYSRLLRGQTGPDVAPTDWTKVEGDLAEGLPEQPSDTEYILKLKPNITFHDKAPMNGRAANAQDFLATYEFFIAEAINRGRFDDVVDSVEATDDLTIKVTLKEPVAPFIVNGLASDQGVWFIPVETINNNQVQTDPVGTGPWMFEKYTPGVEMTWNRNPNFYDSPKPYIERIEASLNRDPQRIMAALQSGDYDYSHALQASQSPDVDANLDPAGTKYFTRGGGISGFVFDYDIAPFGDKRVRQAISMSLDRAGTLAALDPTGNDKWNSFIGTGLVPYWLDPQDESIFGPNAKFFKHDIAEAKKLLAAVTGSDDEIDVNVVSNVDRYGPANQQHWELVAASMREVGFNAQNVYQEYGAYIQSSYFGKFTDDKSVMLGPLIGTVLDPDDFLGTSYSSASARHNWQGTIPEQAELDEMYEKQRGILDQEERTSYIHDLQRFMGEVFPSVPSVNTVGLQYIPPWVQNAYLKSTYATMPETFGKAWFTPERLARG